jgi:SNF2 family DNA or RNA helicase
MNLSLEKLDKDYRKFDGLQLDFDLKDRVVNPVLNIQKISGKYCATLGTITKKANEAVFVPGISLNHNWVFDGGKIYPLPFDAPEAAASLLVDMDVTDLKFSEVLSLLRQANGEIRIAADSNVLEKANVSSKSLILTADLSNLNGRLYPYQEQGVEWMRVSLDSLGGVILADEMGLGKTLQIIALFLIKGISVEQPALIVCPTTLIANWRREIMKFAPSLSILVHRGVNRTGSYKSLMRAKVIITTYDTLVNDISLFRSIDWKFLICDEAQAAKNPDSKRRVALGKIPAQFSIPVTGTPMENTLLDLWSLSELAIPGMLGSKEAFSSLYPDTEAGAFELSEIVDPVILKRQVKDVADDLPLRTDIDLPIDLDEESIATYNRIREEAIAEYGKAGRLVAVGQLALFCAHHWLRSRELSSENWEESVELSEDEALTLFTPKIQMCIQLLREAFLTGKKVLVFASYNHCGTLIERAAAHDDLPEGYWNSINGSTPQEDRQIIVDEFSCYSGPAVLILNPRAAGAGLNITAATIVIHYTQNWNPALEMQASARAHRRGQELPVTIYRLFYQGTIEETMIERSEWKRNLGDVVLSIKSRENDDLNKALQAIPRLEKFEFE